MTHKTIAQRYVLNHELGKGGMGTVYLGQDTRSQTSVAIKQLKPDLTSTELIERFKREGEALRDLNHPNIVKMLDAIEEGGQHYLIMEYVSGGDLSNLKSYSIAAGYGLGFGYIIWWAYGGFVVVQHAILRGVLARAGHLPRDLVKFLDYASSLILLRKVGGGYIFIHRYLLEYFADLETDQQKAGS
jgi:serine/threonine protein kinase